MHPPHLRQQAISLKSAGIPFSEIVRTLGISRNTVACWLYSTRAGNIKIDNRCPFCTVPARPVGRPRDYAHLLGLYLGDGHLLMTQRVPVLKIACDLRYPGLIHEAGPAMLACGARTVGTSLTKGATTCAPCGSIGRACSPSTGRERNMIALSP